MNIDEIKIIYKVKDKEVQLFGEDFVKRNKNNYKLIIDGKEQELKEKYSFGIFSSKKDILEIKLNGITNIINMSFIFSGCDSLSSLPDILKWNTSNVLICEKCLVDVTHYHHYLIYRNGILPMLPI